eukprot:5641085-Prymnesium_polylepis.1
MKRPGGGGGGGGGKGGALGAMLLSYAPGTRTIAVGFDQHGARPCAAPQGTGAALDPAGLRDGGGGSVTQEGEARP